MSTVAKSGFSEPESEICAGPRGLLLTDDGWLATKASSGFEELGVFRMIEISSIKDVKLRDDDKGRLAHWLFKMSLVLGIVGYGLLLIRDYSVIWEGCPDAVKGVLFSGCEGEHNWFESTAIAIGTMGIPFGLVLWIRWSDLWPKTILIELKTGKEFEIKAEFDYQYVWWYLYAFLGWWFLSPIGTDGLSRHFENPSNLVLLVCVFGVFQLVKLWAEFSDSGSKTEKLDAKSFQKRIEKEQEGAKDLQRQLLIERKDLQKYEDRLRKILPDYDTVWGAGSTRQVVSTMATCLEMLLRVRLKQMGEEKWVEGKNRGNNWGLPTLRNLIEKIKSEDDDWGDENHLGLAYICTLRNNSIHAKGKNAHPPELNEVKTAMGYFTKIVKSHFGEPIDSESSE